jgi:tetratricopeptide (TPR) repeat protein
LITQIHDGYKKVSDIEKNLNDTASYLTKATKCYSDKQYNIALVYADLSLKSYEKIPADYIDDQILFFKEMTLIIKSKTLISLKRYNESITCLEDALKINPENAEAWYVSGIALYKQGKYEEAINNLETAKYLDPKNASTFENAKVFMLQKIQRIQDRNYQ